MHVKKESDNQPQKGHSEKKRKGAWGGRTKGRKNICIFPRHSPGGSLATLSKGIVLGVSSGQGQKEKGRERQKKKKYSGGERCMQGNVSLACLGQNLEEKK